jgi:flavin reductase (DIM6/NTAB) family NADH-FMN oxidoreductase RutF
VKHIKTNEILQMERNYRANFINSIGGFKSVVLIGTKSTIGNENLAVFSSLFYLGADPALCGIVVRPCDEKQNTLGNIIQNKHYTINHILPDFVKQAHQSSAKYNEGESEFEKVGLTAQYIDDFIAPFVEESVIKFGCELVQKITIEENGTSILIGKIISIIVPEDVVSEDGLIDIEKAGSITLSGLDTYHRTQKIARLSYAKTDKSIQEL